jgi:tellurite resistance protein
MANLSNEERYFMERELELRDQWRNKLEERAKVAAEHQKIADQIGVPNEEIARRIRELGFDADTTRILHLMPLVEVAWADGSLTGKERRVILNAAEAHGVEPGSQAAILLASMLEKKPTDQVLDYILEILRQVLAARNMHPADVLEACLDVARASGGILGMGEKISDDERQMIERIASGFGKPNSPDQWVCDCTSAWSRYASKRKALSTTSTVDPS